MKKFTYLLILVVSMMGVSGCEEPIDHTAEGHIIYDSSGLNIKRFQFDGHIYLVTCGGYQGGICHDPDCPCMKKKTLERGE